MCSPPWAENTGSFSMPGEIAHMEDDAGAFLGGLWLRWLGLMFTLAFAALLYFWKRGRRDRSAYLARAVPRLPLRRDRRFFSPPAWHWPPSYPQTFPGISLFSTISFLTTTFGSGSRHRYAHQHRTRGVLYGYGSANRHCFCHIRDHFLRSLPVPLAQGAKAAEKGKLILYLCFDFLYNDPKATKWGLFIYEI